MREGGDWKVSQGKQIELCLLKARVCGSQARWGLCLGVGTGCGSAEVKAHWGQGWALSAPPEPLRLQLSHLCTETLNVTITFSASEVKGVGSRVP